MPTTTRRIQKTRAIQKTAAKPATIVDVANFAGVSKSTVSNVIRGTGITAPATIARVRQAIEKLGYRPNILARNLVQGRTDVLGVVVGDLSNPFFSEMAKLIEYHSANHGYRVMFCDAQSEERAGYGGLKGLFDYRVAGLIFLAFNDDASMELLHKSQIPAVFVTCTSTRGDVVTADDVRGGILATDHLIELGHRRIAYAADPSIEDAADKARQEGYLTVMRKMNLPPTIFHWQRSGRHVTRESDINKLLRGPDRITAIFSSNDLGAIELLDWADKLEIPVPRKLSIVGFDNITLAGLRRINLTTVAQPKEILCKTALQTLNDRIRGRLSGGFQRQVVDCWLIVRGTTANYDAG